MADAPNLLILEGNLPANCDTAIAYGTVPAAERYALSLRMVCPQANIRIVSGADVASVLPGDAELAAYDGVAIGGSGLHVYDIDDCVTRQIEFVRAVFEAGVPVLGSCWGTQISVMAAGGDVQKSPYGREVGIARKVTLTNAGIRHPLFSGKSAVFDTPCIHLDEVTQIPAGGSVLASNRHSRVQALAFECQGTPFWGVQYHPEFDLFHMARIYRMYADIMLQGGFFADEGALATYAKDVETLSKNPERRDLAWKIGVDSDVLDDSVRTLEIRNWIEHMVMPRIASRI